MIKTTEYGYQITFGCDEFGTMEYEDIIDQMSTTAGSSVTTAWDTGSGIVSVNIAIPNFDQVDNNTVESELLDVLNS